MVECFVAAPGGIDEDPQVSLGFFLTNIVVEGPGPEAASRRGRLRYVWRNNTGHGYSWN